MFLTQRLSKIALNKRYLLGISRNLSHLLNHYNPLLDYTPSLSERTILLVGDGDLSNGATMAEIINNARPDVKIVASVLESEVMHNTVYKDSMRNIDLIRENGHVVEFEVDATCLEQRFGHGSIDRIQWNFPHWRGKTNNRRNRKLISDFFACSSGLLSNGGQIHLALMNHQGGLMAKTNSEWKSSWLSPIYAGENGLLLSHFLPFQPTYNLSAYQFRDRSFNAEKKASMHLFTKCDNLHFKAPEDIQMYSYFTLFISLPTPANSSGTPIPQSDQLWSNGQILDEKFVFDVLKDKIPDGIRIEIKPLRILRQQNPDDEINVGEWKVIEYQVVLFGESIPITLKDAESYKKAVEDEIQLQTRGTKRGGWNAAHIVPSSLLQTRGW